MCVEFRNCMSRMNELCRWLAQKIDSIRKIPIQKQDTNTKILDEWKKNQIDSRQSDIKISSFRFTFFIAAEQNNEKDFRSYRQ